MPRVRLAPGVSSMSARVMRVVGVTESVATAAPSSPCTCTDTVALPTASAMCTVGLVPEASVRGSMKSAKPSAWTSRSYRPSGASGRANSPSLPVTECSEKAELAAFSITFAPATGRCCGSCRKSNEQRQEQNECDKTAHKRGLTNGESDARVPGQRKLSDTNTGFGELKIALGQQAEGGPRSEAVRVAM